MVPIMWWYSNVITKILLMRAYFFGFIWLEQNTGLPNKFDILNVTVFKNSNAFINHVIFSTFH